MEEIEQEVSVSGEVVGRHSQLIADLANRNMNFTPLMVKMFNELQDVIEKYGIVEADMPNTEAAFAAFISLLEDTQNLSDEVNGVSND